MLKTKIIASEVCSLTDARYFAAWGVDFLAFNCNVENVNYISQDALQEIREWVEGPQIAGSFDSLTEIDEHIQIRNLNAVILSEETLGDATNLSTPVITRIEYVSEEQIVDQFLIMEDQTIIVSVDKQHLDKLLSLYPPSNQCYLEVKGLDLSTIRTIIDNGKYGIVLKGSAEEKVGYKSFDFLDEAYDLLMD